MDDAYFQKYSVFRKPTWRWDRVERLNAIGEKINRRNDDDAVKAGRVFSKRYNSWDESRRPELFRLDRGLYYAYQINEKRNDTPEPALVIEARLLARQSYKQIADEVGTIPDTIEWYEKLFFNVNDRLQNRDWVTTQVLLPAMSRYKGIGNISEDDDDSPRMFDNGAVAKPFLDGSLKFFAYFGGSIMVDTLLHCFRSGKPLVSQEDMPRWFDQHWSDTVRRRSAQASMAFEINKFNIMELFAIHSKIIELDRSEDADETARTTQERHVKAMMDSIPWMIGMDGETVLRGSALASYDSGALELRDDDVQRAASGERIEDGRFLKALPPPRKKDNKTESKPTLQ